MSRLLDELLNEMYPQKSEPPSTFGLEPDELGRHVTSLRQAGWTIGEIAVVIDMTAVPL